jgi:hypothetical protein
MLYKYPRTPHLNWSPGVTKDDKIVRSIDHFVGKRVIVTEKLDGECTTIRRGRIHARSMDSKDHISRHWIKNQYGYLTNVLNDVTRICGENVFAEHSIAYENLISFFYAFSVWNFSNCLSWDDTVKELTDLNIVHVPIIYDGIWDEDFIKNIPVTNTEKGIMEGYVVRMAESFDILDFQYSVAKYVREDHVQTDEHWLSKPVVKNKLKI